MNWYKQRRVVTSAVLLIASLLVGFAGGYLLGTRASRGSREKVLEYSQKMDSDPSAGNISLLQRSEHFQYIREHLADFIGDPKLVSERDSYALSEMVWRAAFLFGTENDIARAFDACIHKGGHVIVRDLASYDATHRVVGPEGQRAHMDLAGWVLIGLVDGTGGGVSGDALRTFVLGLRQRPFDSYGPLDYRPILIWLMRNAKEEETRVYAAHTLGLWSGETEIGKEALRVLHDAQKRKNFSAIMFLRDIERFGTHGWEDPPSGTQPATKSIQKE